jgi:hypothetical protein
MTATTVRLPYNLNGLNLSQVTSEVVDRAQQGWPQEITFDFSNLGFIRPAGVVFLSNLVYWLAQQGTKVHFKYPTEYGGAFRFLDDSLFFQQHCGTKARETAAPRSTTRPLIRIAHSDYHQWLDGNLLPWLSNCLSITQPSLHPLRVCLAELFNNIQDHTRFDIGSVFVQHFPHERNVTCALSDMGVGIPGNVRQKLPDLSDSQAILKAVQAGFTTKSKPSNQGIGLDYLLSTVVRGNGGKVTIYSCEGIVRFQRVGTQVASTVLTGVGFCPGTTFDITLPTDTIEVLPGDREDLQW